MLFKCWTTVCDDGSTLRQHVVLAVEAWVENVWYEAVFSAGNLGNIWGVWRGLYLIPHSSYTSQVGSNYQGSLGSQRHFRNLELSFIDLLLNKS